MDGAAPSRPEPPEGRRGRPLRLLLVLGALLWGALALLQQPGLVERLGSVESASPEALEELARARWTCAGLALLLLAWGLGPARWREGRAPTRLALLVLLGLSPVLAVELACAPYVERPSKIFVPDEELGWRLRPGASEHWLGVPLKINARGMRGPLPREPRPERGPRVLMLGDSVTFGFRVQDDGDTLPGALAAELAARGLSGAEVLNAGVDGWSPWQQAAFLEREGPDLAPDLVVQTFVLNDVTEKFHLERFGGEGPGYQLAHSRGGGVQGWWRGTAWAALLREGRARMRGEASARAGAEERDLLSVYDLMRSPDAARVREAWELTLPQLERVARWCSEHEVDYVLTSSPYTIQLYDPGGAETGAPQRLLARFCAERQIPFLDLLPGLQAAMRREAWTEYDLYLDAIHPSPRGYRVAAGELARFLGTRDLLAR